jgi:methylenetetrahydrofolate reductase (NADPH)
VAQIKRFISMCGAKIPHSLLMKIESVESDADAVHKIGVEYAIQQCKDLLKNQADGLHFYTLNKSKATVEIVKALNAKHAA